MSFIANCIKKALKNVATFKFCLSLVVKHALLSTLTWLTVPALKIYEREVRMHYDSIIFLFLVLRDIIVANEAAKPSFLPPLSVMQ